MSLSPQIPGMEFTTPVRSSTYPPTSVPRPNLKRASTAPERRPKLRASCDACAASKVKCSKEHPICARCSANGSQCVYGISRKHGKPGRTRKRNPDGTPFIKASKQRPSPDGSEFGKFRVRPEPIIHQSLPEFDTISNWSSTWSNPPSLRATPEFEFEMTPEPIYMEPTDFSFMDDLLMPIPPPQFEPIHQTIEQEHLTFRDPFAKKQSVQLDLPDIQALKDFIGGDMVNPLDYTFAEANMVSYFSDDSSMAASSAPQSPKTTPHLNPLRVSVSMPTNSCCSPVAYSTLESLRIIGPDANNGTPTTELKNLDTVLSITKSAVQNVLKLLQCPCSSQPHLAMLYSSIVSKILTWYQIAAGVKPTPPPAAPPSLSSGSCSPSSSVFSSPLSTPGSEVTSFNIQVQPLKFGVYEFDELEQEIFRRQVILCELKKCSQVVEALANWKRDGEAEAEQAEFLYDVLGAWLKSELYKTLKEIEGAQDMDM